MAEHTVAKTADLSEGACKAVTVNGQKIGLFNVEGKIYAMDDTCVHKGGSLGSGSLNGKVVTCPLHGWTYDVTTGACETNPQAQLNTFPVKVEGEEIVVEL